jgi:hypothetical protein
MAGYGPRTAGSLIYCAKLCKAEPLWKIRIAMAPKRNPTKPREIVKMLRADLGRDPAE